MSVVGMLMELISYCFPTELSSPFAPACSNWPPRRPDRHCTVRCCWTWLLRYDSRGPGCKRWRLVAALVHTLIRPATGNTSRTGQFSIAFDLLTMTRVTAQDLPLSFLRSLYIRSLSASGKRVRGQIGYLKHILALS